MTDTEKLSYEFVKKAKEIFGDEFIPLHRPVFSGNEIKYLNECIESNFVSSVGKRVNEMEDLICSYTGSAHAIATVNGTSALHVALQLAGVKKNDEVITQALTFIATCNAISYLDSKPIFIDVDKDTMGMSPESLESFLIAHANKTSKGTFNKLTGKKISACVPMHTFGNPLRIDKIIDICASWNIPVIEDAAESLGSYYHKKHTGTFGLMGTLSFNGNKVITTGGGGMIITNDKEIAKKAKHITTTGKIAHPYEFFHDQIAYNYRMPNLNAALGCAQMEKLDEFLQEKDKLNKLWESFFHKYEGIYFKPSVGRSNYWINSIILNSKNERDIFLADTNSNNVMTRPIWTLMSKLPMFKSCQNDGLINSRWLEERVVNIPSSVPNK